MLCNRVFCHTSWTPLEGAELLLWLPGLPVPTSQPRGRESRVQGSGVGYARAEHGRLPRWLPRSAQAPCPAFTRGVGGFRAGRPRAPWPGAGREGWPGLSLLLTQPPGHQRFIWIGTSGSSSSTTLQKGGENPSGHLQDSEPPLSSVCLTGMGTSGSSAEPCTTGNCSGCSAETPEASLYLLYTVCLSVEQSLYNWKWI